MAIILHWSIALLLIFAIGLNWAWEGGLIPDDEVRYAINWHKSVGIVLLGLVIMRLLWRVTHRPPPLPSGFQCWERRLSALTHLLLYAVMFVMPLSGWIMDSAWKEAAANPMPLFGSGLIWPRISLIMDLDVATRERVHDAFGLVHGMAANLLYLLFVLHIGGALKHQFLDRQPELERMWPRR